LALRKVEKEFSPIVDLEGVFEVGLFANGAIVSLLEEQAHGITLQPLSGSCSPEMWVRLDTLTLKVLKNFRRFGRAD